MGEQSGGEIEVSSVLIGGSTLTIYLPRAEIPTGSPEISAVADETVVGPQPLRACGGRQ
jgi:hypothetical protein